MIRASWTKCDHGWEDRLNGFDAADILERRTILLDHLKVLVRWVRRWDSTWTIVVLMSDMVQPAACIWNTANDLGPTILILSWCSGWVVAW